MSKKQLPKYLLMLQQSLLTTRISTWILVHKFQQMAEQQLELVNATQKKVDEAEIASFKILLLDVEKPLYKGCSDFTKLSAIVKLLKLKGMRTIDKKFPKIVVDPRNLRLGISADGVDVNSGTRHHSVWPVLPVIYNLPPWLCMKRKFIMLLVLISGYLGNDIDVFSRTVS
ncbi:hypothetical protein Tco_0243121 [Tanacetum coccineum]